MTPEAAIYSFLNGFSIPAYASSSVPDQSSPEWQGFPYITYDLVLGEWGQPEVNMPVNVWYRTDSEAGMGGVTLPCDGGMLWVKKGSPWAQAVTVEGEDEKVKRRYININIEFLTID